MSLPDASMDSYYCRAETPGSTSINTSVAGRCGFFNRPVRGNDGRVVMTTEGALIDANKGRSEDAHTLQMLPTMAGPKTGPPYGARSMRSGPNEFEPATLRMGGNDERKVEMTYGRNEIDLRITVRDDP